jgi:hypothetical protein
MWESEPFDHASHGINGVFDHLFSCLIYLDPFLTEEQLRDLGRWVLEVMEFRKRHPEMIAKYKAYRIAGMK